MIRWTWSRPSKKSLSYPVLDRACLSTTNGIKIAGKLRRSKRGKKPSLACCRNFSERTRLQFEELLGAGMLETITLHFGLHQVSTFVKGRSLSTVLHDNRPFKPGVREKIQAVISELATLGRPKSRLIRSPMPTINYANKEIQFKIVYYGPALGGKTTNLAYIHSRIAPAHRGDLVSLATAADRTLFLIFCH